MNIMTNYYIRNYIAILLIRQTLTERNTARRNLGRDIHRGAAYGYWSGKTRLRGNAPTGCLLQKHEGVEGEMESALKSCVEDE
jgi:hypothetical protein